MVDAAPFAPAVDEAAIRAGYEAEIARLNKVIAALVDRAERAATVNHSAFGLFQTSVLLDERVRQRTAELEHALRENERINRALRSLQEQLQEQAIRDPLTGLYNRRFLSDALDNELRKAGEAGTSVAVIMADIDRFKVVNDTYGHPVGDAVLRAFADVLRRSMRSHDICCRFGGEEFLLAFPGLSMERACARAQAIRATLADVPLRLDGLKLSVTASFGVASFPQHAASVDALIAVADQALYRAKQAGRNRVECARVSVAPAPYVALASSS